MSGARTAAAWLAAGCSIVPIRCDGSKAPAFAWKRYQNAAATIEQVRGWFNSPEQYGIAVVCGAVSGNLEVLDFDEDGLLEQFVGRCHEQCVWVVDILPVVETPSGGRHLYYRLPEPPPGNLKLAVDAARHTRIETRGEGGYCVAPGSPTSVHPAGLPYRFASKHMRPARIPTIDTVLRDELHRVARTFDLSPTPAPLPKQVRQYDPRGTRQPKLEAYQSGVDGLSLLIEAGWFPERATDHEVFLRRPGKRRGISASYRVQGGPGLYVWSTNAHPFEPGWHSNWCILAQLKHGGDYKAARHAILGGGPNGR